MSEAMNRFVAALESKGCKPKNGKARCPAHPDEDPSLTYKEGSDGRVLVYCHAGCDTSSILNELGLEMADLFEGDRDEGDDLAPEHRATTKEIAQYDYVDEAGVLVFQVVRYSPKDFRQRRPDENGGWIFSTKDITPKPLYNLPAVLGADLVLVTEGEKDADTLTDLGYVATTSSGGSRSASRTDWTPLIGKRAILIPDNDDSGTKYRDEVSALLVAASATEVRAIDPLVWASQKDVTEWLANGHTPGELAKLIEDAPILQPNSATVLTMRRGDELIELDLPPLEPVVTPVINSGEVVEIVAFRGTGKTFFGLTLAAAIAAGVDPFAGWSVPTARPALYIDGELPLPTTQTRVGAVYAGLKVEVAVPMYVVCKTDEANRGRFRNLSEPEGRADVTELVEQVFGAHGTMPVLFLDNLSCLLGSADENSRESFAPVGEWMIELRGRGVTIVFFHHTGWSQARGRGTSAREDAVDLVVRLCAPGNVKSSDGARFEVLFDKARNLEGKAVEEFELSLVGAPGGGVVFSRSANGERREVDQRAEILDVVAAKPGCSLNHVKKSVTGRGDDIAELVRKMIATGEMLNRGEGTRYALFVGDRFGVTSGTTADDGSDSNEDQQRNRTEPRWNRLGTTPGTAGGSVVPTPIEGGGNHHGEPHISADLSVDPLEWNGPHRDRVDEVMGSGFKAAAAVERVLGEFAVEVGEQP